MAARSAILNPISTKNNRLPNWIFIRVMWKSGANRIRNATCSLLTNIQTYKHTYESAQESEHLVKFFTWKSDAIIDKILIEGHKSRSINGVSVRCTKSRSWGNSVKKGSSHDNIAKSRSKVKVTRSRSYSINRSFDHLCKSQFRAKSVKEWSFYGTIAKSRSKVKVTRSTSWSLNWVCSQSFKSRLWANSVNKWSFEGKITKSRSKVKVTRSRS